MLLLLQWLMRQESRVWRGYRFNNETQADFVARTIVKSVVFGKFRKEKGCLKVLKLLQGDIRK